MDMREVRGIRKGTIGREKGRGIMEGMNGILMGVGRVFRII